MSKLLPPTDLTTAYRDAWSRPPPAGYRLLASARQEPARVYVDPLLVCVPNGRWRWNRSCHMFADTLDALHAFAARIGLRRAWFQDKTLPHYDLHPNTRAKALAAGAIELDRQQAAEMWRARGWTRRTAAPAGKGAS